LFFQEHGIGFFLKNEGKDSKNPTLYNSKKRPLRPSPDAGAFCWVVEFLSCSIMGLT
jgi:hypothetical protein